MVNNMESEYRYTVADDHELNELLEGREAGIPLLLSDGPTPTPPTRNLTGVVWTRGSKSRDPVRPLALVCNEEDLRRLCGRYAQLHSDLSPLSSWCYLMSPQLFHAMRPLPRVPDLAGMEAAWAGLVVAEAVLLAEKPLVNIRIPACMATKSFAIARAKSLWDVSSSEVIAKFDSANRLCRAEGMGQRSEARANRIRIALQPIWSSLSEVTFGERQHEHAPYELRPIITSLKLLLESRQDGDPEEAWRFASPLSGYAPEVGGFQRFSALTPEERLRLFDTLIASLGGTDNQRDAVRRNSLSLLAGYLATVAAGGKPSLTLAESIAQRWPEITAWAYVIGGIGERVSWTSAFDGLGRLVARELRRTLRLDEPPSCDFALDEAAVLADSKLADPLVHLKLKQGRTVSVALYPGVNVATPLGDVATQESTKARPAPELPSPALMPGNLLIGISEALWPYLRARVLELIRSEGEREGDSQGSEESHRGRGRRRPGSYSQLPLTHPKR